MTTKLGQSSSRKTTITRDRVFPDLWAHDPRPIRQFVQDALREGLAITTIEHSRRELLPYRRFLIDRFNTDLRAAGWKEFASYRQQLVSQGLARGSVRCYLTSIARYYLLRARNRMDAHAMDVYERIKAVTVTANRRNMSRPYPPFSMATLQKLVAGARSYSTIRRWNRDVESEDFVIIMLLLYTGGRSQFYGLRVEEIDFETEEIRTVQKGNLPLTIPLHPTLGKILRAHLANRKYASPFLFRNGRSSATLHGRDVNQGNALRACQRVGRAAGVDEPVHPHRFRKTLATIGRDSGMDLQSVQAILGHRSPVQTMNLYARPDLGSAKRAFSQLDLVEGPMARSDAITFQIMPALRQLAPPGREEAWNMLIEGFAALFLGANYTEDQSIWRAYTDSRHSRVETYAWDH